MKVKLFFARIINFFLRPLGYHIQANRMRYPDDFTPAEIEDIQASLPFSQTSSERMVCLRRAVRYIVDQKIPGALVECGVWKGGSMMLMAKALQRPPQAIRSLYLFDTFAGMPDAKSDDINTLGVSAQAILDKQRNVDAAHRWNFASLEEVRERLQSTGYPKEQMHFIVGKVEDTLPIQAPETIALLRLDMDLYAPTYHALIHLFPRLSSDGILIIDDYGFWKGVSKAVDTYFAERQIPVFWSRIDDTAVMMVKK